MGQEAIIRCLCGQFKEKIRLRDEIPIGGFLCHCDSCRQRTGGLAFSGLALVDPPIDVFEQKLEKYSSSEKITEYFCKTCGSHPVYVVTKEGRYNACPGAIDEVIGGNQGKLEKYISHEFAGDTIDGGLAWLFPGVPIYNEADNEPAVADMASLIELMKSKKDGRAADEGKVRARCHCGQADLWVLPPEGGGKWKGGICACRSCRLAISQPLAPWVLNIAQNKVVWADGTVYDDNTVHPSVVRYQSSDHAHRDFCPKCSACVLYSSKNEPGMMDVAAGLLRAPEGSLAKSSVEWDLSKVYHIEDAFDKVILEQVRQNLKELQKA